ncbi:MAG TPA: sensor histidine kinase [Chitinophagales bacterium]|nr:sensor histidine kinase [Chitinophagales bacterium]
MKAIRFRCVLTVLCFLCNDVKAQTSLDSIDTELRKQPNDTLKINRLISLENADENSNPSKAILYGKEALALSTQLHYRKGIIQSLNCIGRAFKSVGNFDSSLYYLRKSASEAIFAKDNHLMAISFGNIGTIFRNQGIYDSASLYYHRALNISESINDSEITASCLNNIGNVLKDQNNIEEAIHYYSNALDIRQRQDNKHGVANAQLNLGICYGILKQYSTSDKFLNEALKIYLLLHDKTGMAKCYNNIGQSLMSQGKNREAIGYLNKALELQEKLGDENGKASTLWTIASLYNSEQGSDQALQYTNKSLGLSIKIGNKELEEKNYNLLQSINVEKGNYRDAYIYLDKAFSLRDSIFNESKTRIIGDLQTKYETEKKNARILFLDQENKTKNLQRNILLFGSITLLIILCGLSFIFIQSRRLAKQKLRLRDQEISDLLQEQAIKTYNALLVGQEEERKRIAVDLHDRLGSILSTVKVYFSALRTEDALSGVEKSELQDKASSLLDLSFDEVRKIANNLSTGLISDSGLRPAIEELCETISNGGNVKCKIYFNNLNGRINNQTEIGIYRIIQELLSNILKHAQAKNIVIQLTKIDEHLQVSVEDDGTGYNYSEKLKSPGMGLKNILTRVKKLNGTFHVDSMPEKGTFSLIEIPIGIDELDSSQLN